MRKIDLQISEAVGNIVSGFRPRPGQTEILAYQGGLMGVSAVPGSGKTATIAALTALMLYGSTETAPIIFARNSPRRPNWAVVVFGGRSKCVQDKDYKPPIDPEFPPATR